MNQPGKPNEQCNDTCQQTINNSAWILNSCCKSGYYNEAKMLQNNRGFIGFGKPEEKREDKKTNTTIKQFNKFKQIAKKGDNIYLYKNKVGVIAIGEYTGEYYEPQFIDDKAPDWNIDEKQCHIGIKWDLLPDPIKYKPLPRTLYFIKSILH